MSRLGGPQWKGWSVRGSDTPSPDTGDAPDGVEVDSATAALVAERSRLVGLAYRITGSRLDAEDVVQEAWLRAQRVDWSTVDRPAAWLTRVVARLSLDRLKSAQHRRETYVGPWLPEPVLTGVVDARGSADPAEASELSESLTLGFLRVLDSLAPLERVVFLMADVFGTPYDEIATTVDRSPGACRQIASRARRKVRARPVRHDPPDAAARVAADLMAALVAGDVDRVLALLADDVVLLSDGGPDAYAARRPVVGRDRVGRFVGNMWKRFEAESQPAIVNGEPGLVFAADGRPVAAISSQIVDGRVATIHVVVNPDKLAALAVTTPIT